MLLNNVQVTTMKKYSKNQKKLKAESVDYTKMKLLRKKNLKFKPSTWEYDIHFCMLDTSVKK